MISFCLQWLFLWWIREYPGEICGDHEGKHQGVPILENPRLRVQSFLIKLRIKKPAKTTITWNFSGWRPRRQFIQSLSNIWKYFQKFIPEHFFKIQAPHIVLGSLPRTFLVFHNLIFNRSLFHFAVIWKWWRWCLHCLWMMELQVWRSMVGGICPGPNIVTTSPPSAPS